MQFTCKVKVKLSRYRPGGSLGFPEVEAPEFLENRHIKVVRLSALRSGRLYPQEAIYMYHVKNKILTINNSHHEDKKWIKLIT